MDFSDEAVRQVEASCKALGVAVPESLTKVRQANRKARAYLDALPTRSSVQEATQAALDAGGDPLQDADVRERIIGYQLRLAVHDVVGNALTRRENEAGIAAFSEWLAVVRPVFDDAAAALTNAREVLGDVNLDDAAVVLKRGPKAAEAWASIARASKVIETVRRAWYGFMAAKLGTVPQESSMCVVKLDLEQALRNPLAGDREPYELLRAGWSLQLNGPGEVRKFNRQVEQERQNRAAKKRAGYMATARIH